MINSNGSIDPNTFSILDSLSDGIIACDPKGGCIYLNAVARSIFKVDQEQVKGHLIWDFVPDEYQSIFHHEYLRLISDTIPVHFVTPATSTCPQLECRMVSSPDGFMLLLSKSIRYRTISNDEERFKLLLRHGRDIILFLEPGGWILEANDMAAESYGYSREELLSMNVFDLRHSVTSEVIQQQLQKAISDGILFETVHRRKDGSIFPVEVNSHAATLGEDHILVSIIRDISERKEAEQLATSLNHINIAVSSTLIPDEIFRHAAAGAVKALNADSAAIYRLNDNQWVAEQIIGCLPRKSGIQSVIDPSILSDFAFVPGEPVLISDISHDSRVKHFIQHQMQTQSMLFIPFFTDEKLQGLVVVSFQTKLYTFSRHQIHFIQELIVSVSLSLENASLYQIQRRAVKQETIARNTLQRIIDHIPAAIAVLDSQEFRAKWANQAYLNFLEEPFKSQGITGYRLQEYNPIAEECGLADIFRHVAQTGELYFYPEDERIGPEGVSYWNWSLIKLSADETSTPDLMVLAIDVTEQVIARKKVEYLADQSKQSLAQIQAVLSSMSDGLIVIDACHHIVQINQAALQLLRYNDHDTKPARLQDMLSQFDLLTKDSKIYTLDEWPSLRVIRGETISDLEIRTRNRQTGEELILNYNGTPVYDINQRPVLAIVTFRDITRRIHDEQEIKRQKALLSSVTTYTKACFAYMDEDFRLVWVNPALVAKSGYSIHELIGKSAFEIAVSDEIQRIFNLVKETGHPFSIDEMPFSTPAHPDWGLTYWSWSLNPIKDNEDKIVSYVLSMIDATDSVQARHEIDYLRAKAEQKANELDTIFMSLTDAVIVYNANGFPIQANPPAQVTCGFDLTDFDRQTILSTLNICYPDGRPLSLNQLPSSRGLRGEIVINESLQFTNINGAEYSISVSAAPLIQNDRVVGTVSIWHDVTELRRAEKERAAAEMELRSREAQIRSLFESMQEVVALAELIYDSDGNAIDWIIRDVNTRYVQLMGVPREKIIGQTASKHYQSEDLFNTHLKLYQQVIQMGTPVQFDSHNSESGRYFRTSLSKTGEGLIVSVSTDITQIVEAQKVLEEAFYREHHVSHELQRALLPDKPKIDRNYEVATAYMPAYADQEIGGDFYDVFKTRHGEIAVLIGDVSGKGIEAAAVAAITRSMIHAFAFECSCPGQTLTHTNAALYAQIENYPDFFVTVFLAIIDPSSGQIRYSSAGHPPAMILHTNHDLDLLSSELPMIGVFPDLSFEPLTASLEKGEKLVLYTDGIIESRRGDDLFEIDGLIKTLKQMSHFDVDEIASEILGQASLWADGHLVDDTAIVVIARSDAANDGSYQSSMSGDEM